MVSKKMIEHLYKAAVTTRIKDFIDDKVLNHEIIREMNQVCNAALLNIYSTVPVSISLDPPLFKIIYNPKLKKFEFHSENMPKFQWITYG